MNELDRAIGALVGLVLLPAGSEDGRVMERRWNAGGRVFNLPSPPRYRLDRPPLAQALAQVRFDVRARLAALDGIAPVQDRLESLFPYMAALQQQQVSMVLGPGGAVVPPQVEPPQTSWRFTDDAGWSLVVAPQEATLAVGSEYESVDEIARRFRAVVGALSDGGRVSRCVRLGVRYINLAELPPGDDTAWQSWFRRDFIGWVGGDVLSAQMVASVSQTQVAAPPVGEFADIPASVEGIIRHGVVPQNTVIPGLPEPIAATAYLIDVDLFVQGAQPMAEQELGRQFSLLHGQIDRFFRWTLSATGEEHFGLQEVAE